MDPHRYNRHSMFLRKDKHGNSDPKCVRESIMLRAVACLSWPIPHGVDPVPCHSCSRNSSKPHPEEDVGLLVPLGFDITAFTPAAYQRGSLPRPSKDVSS